MLSTHPTVEDFERFLQGSSRLVSLARNAQILRHLLSNCAVCHERLRALHEGSRCLDHFFMPESELTKASATTAANAYDYSSAFAAVERAVSALLAPGGQKAESPTDLLRELDSLPPDERSLRLSAGGRFAHPALIDVLIERSHNARYRDAEEMLSLAHMARLAADACSTADADNELRLADLRTRAWGQYGNALRVAGRPREAEEALATAQRYFKAGTGDPMLRAWLLERTTPLAIFQGRFEEAIEMCDEAGEICRDLGESHLLAKTLVQRAIAAVYSGSAEGAVRILNQAIPLIDHEEEPHLLLAACHNLVRCYIDLGRPDQALQIYTEIKELYEEFEDPLILLRATWQEGQLLRDLGHLEPAETILLRARKGYTERKLAYEAALVSLDLATVYVKLGQVDKLKRTVLETVPIFHSLHVGLETLASLLQLQKVADQEQQALDLIQALSARIEPLRRERIEES